MLHFTLLTFLAIWIAIIVIGVIGIVLSRLFRHERIHAEGARFNPVTGHWEYR
jgi:uncharacterized membrane protein YjjB (DUF3815 family)